MEILHRAKRVDNGEYVYGYYCPKFDSKNNVQIPMIQTIKGKKYEIDLSTLSRFTELLDLSGVEIFEDDEFTPLYLAPFENLEKTLKRNDLDNDEMGIIKIEYGEVVLKKYNGESRSLSDYIEHEVGEYIPNVGNAYKCKNNIALGYVTKVEKQKGDL